MPSTTRVSLAGVEGAIFDLDGVITDTATAHAEAWKRLFDDYLATRGDQRPFDEEDDYRRYVDGKPRYDGANDFLRSRGIELPFGWPGDAPTRETVCGLGNRKHIYYREHLRAHGARAFPAAERLLRRLRQKGVRTAVVSSSRDLDLVLEVTGITDLFDARVGGREAAELDLPGKPDPAVYIEAAHRLGVDPSRAAVFEDALAGVRAGHAGDFHLVVGVGDRREELLANGADVVVADLSEVEA